MGQLIPAKPLVEDALQRGYGVPAINTNGGNYDIVRACLETAQELRSPLILQVYNANAEYYGLDFIAYEIARLARDFTIPVALHFDHGPSFERAVQAIRAGFTSVMLDKSKEPLEVNIAETRRVVEVARGVGVSVEAEIGHLLSGESDPDNPNLASVEDVQRFTSEVQVDMLAVAIGNSHGFYKGIPKINIERVRQIRQVTDVPLVMHGSTGIPEETMRQVVKLGMAKINYGTLLRTNWIKYCRELMDTMDHMGHPWRVCRAVKDQLKNDVAWIIGVMDSAGKA